MSILCTIKNLHLSFANKTLFEDASFNISFGDRIGLLGLNGKGKSSLFKVLTESVKPDNSIPPFQFDKAKGDGDPSKAFSVFLVPQEIIFKDNENPTIKDFIFTFYPEVEVLHRELESINEKINEGSTDEKIISRQKDLLEKYDHLDAWTLIQNYESYLKFFGLNDHEKLMRDLSGGEQKKVLLSLGLSTPKNLVLWDEPTNHLDLETIKVFEEELMNTNKTFLMISHDRYLLSKLCSRIFHINRGKIETFKGSYEDYITFLSENEEARMKQLQRLSNSLRRETEWMRQGIKARGTRSKKRVENYHDLKKSISDLKDKTKREVQLQLHNSNRKTKILVETKEISFSYDNKELFKDVSVNICKGDKIGLIGRNGVGKSTLLHLLRKELTPTSGSVKQADDLQIQYFSQNRNELDPNKTPFELLGDGTDTVFLPGDRKMHVNAYFESFLFNKDEIRRPLKTFSGGERNRLQMAMNLMKDGDIWIFDEPTNDLDLETLNILETKLREFPGSLILISHDRSFLANVTTKVWHLDQKNVEVFEAGYEQVEPYLEALYMDHILDEHKDDYNEEELEEKVQELAKAEKSKSEKIPLSNKEKERLKEIPTHIDILERELDNVEKSIGNFDFSSMDEQKSQEFSALSGRQEMIEGKILELYEELEELESRL
ncbi:ABC-F family ATP-binding cassette domain-containing protein [Halobacteriovorax sp. GB3]|uniref:ABC-F family ATP-binding cassette domain-containing protein n=1 Tax=Halobacteriovorax sp. GB3 TaxID=2719615 RepID=UPI002361D0FA|nr:ABC-F family ATP-binding cassette domain-containing protein [Halobacteriovorax sp. GB3]MDD0854035.1 ABC-F family ATP-binding cassette domain-containing protein [Halobacteriovorax sp. GB3]